MPDPANPSLVEAARDGTLWIVKKKLEIGVDVDSEDSVGRTALYHAASGGHKTVVRALLAKNADVNAEDDDGETPFIAALAHKHFSIAALLLEAGANINGCSGRQAQTPLHWAFNMDLRDEKTERVLWLLDKGADPHGKGGGGLDVLERARDYERKWPFAGEILGHMEEFIRTHDPAYIRAQEMRRLREELCAAIHGGLKEDIQVRPIRLKLPKPKSA